MLRIQKNLVINVVKNISAYLRLDIGVGSQVPESAEGIQTRLQERIREQQRMLQKLGANKVSRLKGAVRFLALSFIEVSL